MRNEKLEIRNYRSVVEQRKPKLFTIHYSLLTTDQREVH